MIHYATGVFIMVLVCVIAVLVSVKVLIKSVPIFKKYLVNVGGADFIVIVLNMIITNQSPFLVQTSQHVR